MGSPSQVTLKTTFTVCFAVLAVVTLAVLIVKAEVALILTGLAALIAVALNHLVVLLMRLRMKRGPAITLVLSVLLFALVTVALWVIPSALTQVQALVEQAPGLVAEFRASRFFRWLDAHFHILQQLRRQDRSPSELASGALPPLLHAVTGAFSLAGAAVTVGFLVVFMLVFGPGLVRRMLSQALPERRARYERVLGKVYTATGGYLGGLSLICSINATLTTTFLAIIGMPYFLPLGIMSGFSSMIPYAGPIMAGGAITLLTLATGGLWKAMATFIYFILYGQLEGNVLAPLVFRRTVHVDPLLTLFAVVFFAELAGIIGAVLAVPLVAAAQIIVRELLLVRREKLGERVPPVP
ncbi:AI-2E family transporter [Archangium violaceum]|uniref:AI-2E family transporter n=1 Tax=Archangium violaceum TaxID=83451 RepID=UPI0019519B5D|nr:AI-2E family transporter [Archangium violaceum]QRN93847.1 AI-2E family transporter [Archangium violaceum]